MEMADICYIDASKKPQRGGGTPGQLSDAHEIVGSCLSESEVVKLQTSFALIEGGSDGVVDLDELAHKVQSRLPSVAFGQIAAEHIRTHCHEWFVASPSVDADDQVEFDREMVGAWPGVAYQPACFPLPHVRSRKTHASLPVDTPSGSLRRPASPLTTAPVVAMAAQTSAATSHTNGAKSSADNDTAAESSRDNGATGSVTDHNTAQRAVAAVAATLHTPERAVKPTSTTPVEVASTATDTGSSASFQVVGPSSPMTPHALRFDHFEQHAPVRAALDDLARTQLQKLADLLSAGNITAEQYSQMSVRVLKVAGFTR